MPFSWDQLIPGQSQTFKEKIISLYIEENFPLDGDDGVREYMKKHYNFDKSVSTYRREFPKWGVKKNNYPATVNRSSHHSFDSGYGTASNRTSTATMTLDSAPSPHRRSEPFLSRSGLLQGQQSSHPQANYTLPESHEVDLHIPEVEATDDENALSGYTVDDDLSDHYPPEQENQPSHARADEYADRHHYQSPHAHPSRCSRSGTISESRNGGLESCHHCGATKLHHLASISRSTDITLFKEVVSSNLSLANQLDVEGNSCLHFAVGAGASLEQLATLQQAGAHLTRWNYSRQSVLHVLDPQLYARTTPTVLNWALQKGLTFLQRDCDGKTPLHCIFGRKISLTNLHDLMPFLQAEGRAMTFVDRSGKTPFDILQENWQKTNGGVHLAQVRAIFIANSIPVVIRREDHSERRPPTLIPDAGLVAANPDEQLIDVLDMIKHTKQDPYHQDGAGQNVLHALARFSFHASYKLSCCMNPCLLLDCLQHLLHNCRPVAIDVNQYNHEGLTPLHCFLSATLDINQDSPWLVPECVEALLQAGADPTLQDRHGNTALHLASRHGRFECAGKILNFLSKRLDRAHYLRYLSSLNGLARNAIQEAMATMSSETSEANHNRRKCIGFISTTLKYSYPAITSSPQSALGHQETPSWPSRKTSLGGTAGEQQSTFEV